CAATSRSRLPLLHLYAGREKLSWCFPSTPSPINPSRELGIRGQLEAKNINTISSPIDLFLLLLLLLLPPKPNQLASQLSSQPLPSCCPPIAHLLSQSSPTSTKAPRKNIPPRCDPERQITLDPPGNK